MRKITILLLLFLGSIQLQAQFCDDFDQNATTAIQGNFSAAVVPNLLGNWGTRCADLQYDNVNSQNGVSDVFLRAFDRGCSNASSWMFNSTDFNGDWVQFIAGNTNCFCYDFRVFSGGGGSTANSLRIYNGADPFNSTLRARFVLNTPIVEADGWQTICAPVGLTATDGTLPSSSVGTWVMEIGTNWDALIQNVGGVAYYLDLTGSPTEVFGFDNICISNCNGTSCNDAPYIEPYWDFCDSNNVCELDDFPIRVLDDDGTPLLAIDGYTFLWTDANGNTLGTSSALFGAMTETEYTLTVTYPDGCVYTITYIKECCEDEISVFVYDCLDAPEFNRDNVSDTNQVNIVKPEDLAVAQDYYNNVKENGEDCDPCDAPVPVVYITVLSNGSVITNYQSVVISWPGNPTGIPIADPTQPFAVYTDINYTITVTVLDPEGHTCVYTYDFIYECETECEVTAPTNLQVVGNTLTWDPVPGAIGYIISSPAGNVPQIDCGCKGTNGVSIAPVSVNTNSYTLPASLSDKCFVWQVTAICEDESQSPISAQACYTPEVREDCETTAPTNLQVSGSTLSWNAVPGASYYIISSPAGNVPQINCGCQFGISIAPISPIYTNSYTLPSNLANRCFVWQVTAVCESGKKSPISTQACYGANVIGDGNIKDVKEKVTIYPNPNNGVMDVKLEMDGRQEVTLNIHRFDGTLIKTIENSKITNGELNLNLNLKSSLQKGLYFFTFTSGDKTITKKVMIE